MKEISKEEKEAIYDMYTKGGGVIKCIHEFNHGGKIIKRVLAEYGIGEPSKVESEFSTRKPFGYWNDKQRCEEVAKLCRNRGEFSKTYVSAYAFSKKNGWISDFDKYFDKEPMFVDYNKPVHTVYVYEVIETHSVYVGRTTNLKRRDNSHRKDDDTINRHCRENNIEVPKPKVLVEHINAQESQVQEGKWVEYYRDNGWNVLNKAITGKGSSSLGATNRKWTYEACSIVATECTSKEDYRKKYPTAHRVATQNKWINDFFSNVKRDNGCFSTIEQCIKECKKYKSIGDLRSNYPFLYHRICKNKWNQEIWAAIDWK